MGRIKKAAGPKHEATLVCVMSHIVYRAGKLLIRPYVQSPALSQFVSTAISLPLARLPPHLYSFPARWPFPRGDLYHWIPLLDHFDKILEDVITEYRLNEGPQTQSFGTKLLERYGTNEETGLRTDVLQAFGLDGDRKVIETILLFSKMLMENCGNRSLYSSSDRLGSLLNTTSLSLLLTTLRLMTRLAQRYHASRQRGAKSGQHLNATLLASHYNIELDHVQKLADPFVKTGPPMVMGSTTTPATTPGFKGKEKAFSDAELQKRPRAVVSGSDMFAAVKDEAPSENGVEVNGKKLSASQHRSYDDWGDVWFSYYQGSPAVDDEHKLPITSNGPSTTPSAPDSPTPVRRASALSRPSRLSMSEDSSNSPGTSAEAKTEEAPTNGLRTVSVSHSIISSTALENILEANLPDIPKEYHYEFLSKLRVAKALTESLHTRRQILAIRILAVTNLAYIYPDPTFQQKILQLDSDEPRRLQLVYQLAELIHPPDNGKAGIPLDLKIIAVGALEALSKHKNRASDVSTALSINVNHGVLLYVLRKTVADLATEDAEDNSTEGDEWRDAIFSLLEALPATAARTAESLVGAGLFDILIEVLMIRTSKAERTHPKVLMFMNNIVYTVRDALMTFANSKGLDAVSDLISWEVTTSLQLVRAGKGLPAGFRNQVIDYEMPYFQQQTLRWLFKFVNHMMQHGNTNFDRLLRNLIDSPHLLSGLRQVLSNAKVFGSNVWSGAVNILSSFIHNEPTSYAVIAEAGLSKAFLEAITMKEIESIDSQAPDAAIQPTMGENGDTVDTVIVPTGSEEQPQPNRRVKIARANGEPLARGILPATDAIVTIPQAFGAICLNTSGLELFLKSNALESFFEVFESPDHVKSMSAEIDLPRLLGNSFDELVRHHPRLRPNVMSSVIVMLARVVFLCRSRAWQNGVGAKLWTESEDGHLRISGGKQSLLGDIADLLPAGLVRDFDEDVVMGEPISLVSGEEQPISVSATGELAAKSNDIQVPSVATYINVAAKFLAGFFENNTLCAMFIEAGGIEFILDFATLPSLPYDFNNQQASQEIAKVIHMLVEQKPHLVLPSLINRTLRTLDVLEPLIGHSDDTSFFSQFTSNSSTTKGKQLELVGQSDITVNGTAIVKALVNIHTLCNIFYEAFTQPIFSNRTTHTLFSQTNLADMYITLVNKLGRLHRACVWEEILLQNSIPDSLKEATRIKGYGMGSDEADEVFGFISRDPPTAVEDGSSTTLPASSITIPPSSSQTTPLNGTTSGTPGGSAAKIEDSVRFKNVQSIRYLLSQIPSSITPFFQGLGKALVPKRRLDSYLRQSAYMVAEALAEATLGQLQYDLPKRTPDAKDRYAYWIVVLTSISQLMIEG
jgi:E3 ubiquitin-protein ligase HUWE1